MPSSKEQSTLDLGRAWTWKTLREAAIRLLEEHQVPEARRSVEWLLGDVLQCSRAQLYSYPEREVVGAAIEAFDRMLRRRLRREPLQYIMGYAEFYGLRLQVSPAVLIPRPETEQVVAAALNLLESVPTPRVLDLGTGSGCMALAVKHERPEAAVYACDLSSDALAIARLNADALDLSVAFFRADMLSQDVPTLLPGPFDLILSNPPYVPQTEAAALSLEVRAFEPSLALFSDDDPLQFYRALIAQGEPLLAPDGVIVFETHAYYAASVRDLLVAAHYRTAQVHHDLAGLPRIVWARRPISE